MICLIDLESIQHNLSSDYGLNIRFSSRFPYIHKHAGFCCFFFQKLYSHIDKNSGECLRILFSSKKQIRESP